jgi:hypothetical protein
VIVDRAYQSGGYSILDPKGQGYHLSHLLAALDFALLVILAIEALLPGVPSHRIT